MVVPHGTENGKRFVPPFPDRLASQQNGVVNVASQRRVPLSGKRAGLVGPLVFQKAVHVFPLAMMVRN